MREAARQIGNAAIATTVIALAAIAMPALSETQPMVCLSPPYTDAKTPIERRLANQILQLQSDVAAFPSLLEAWDTRAPTLCEADHLVLEKAYLDPIANRIVLSSDLGPELSRAVLVHELRHVEQHMRDICPSDVLAMKAHAHAILALEADAALITLIVTWQLRMAGDDGPWNAIAAWGMTSDIAEEFAAVMRRGDDPAKAAEAAFAQWYAVADRRDRYYFSACSQYLDREDAAHAIPSYRQLAEDYLERVCVLPDGSPYPCAHPTVQR